FPGAPPLAQDTGEDEMWIIESPGQDRQPDHPQTQTNPQPTTWVITKTNNRLA
ncbi:14510_t:CDS:1, partial [Acaulospora colombiana]